MKSNFSALCRMLAAVVLGLVAGQTASFAQIFSLNSITNNGSANNPIGLRFSEPVSLPSATNVFNYTVNDGTVIVTNVILQTNGLSVTLYPDSAVGEFFSVSVSNVLSMASNVISAAASGYTSDYSSSTVGTTGDPDPAGVADTSFWDSFDVTVGGSGVGGFSDSFHFVYQQLHGDFDIRTLVTRLDMADPSSQAGLMARETFDPDSPTIQAYFTPPGGANEIVLGVRATVGDDTTDTGFQIGSRASATPLRWLRMTRTNDVFTAYHGTNGVDWTSNGVTTQAFSTNLHVGLMTSSHANGIATTASFTDFSAQGARLGDGIVPTLSVSLNATNLTASWDLTPRDFAVEISNDLSQWSLLLLPIIQSNATERSMQIPLSLAGSPLFIRLSQVDRVIPRIPGIKVSSGIILSPGSGLTSTGIPGNTFCITNVVDPATAFKPTASPIEVPAGTVGDFNTTPSSDSVDTVLQVRNTALASPVCDDNAAGLLKSRVNKSAFPSANTKFNLLTAAKAGTTPTAIIKLRINY